MTMADATIKCPCWILAISVLALAGCEAEPDVGYDTGQDGYGDVGADLSEIQFKDTAETNTDSPAEEISKLSFSDADGNTVKLADFQGEKNVVLVITRGYNGTICPFCTAQTSRLVRNHEEFAKRNAEVVVVYPGKANSARDFQAKIVESSDVVGLPFAIFLDENLAAVDRLGIRSELAKPSTYILDREGKLRFAYVGRTPSDRPSLKAIYKQLDLIEQQ
jgi:peroxiredoxin